MSQKDVVSYLDVSDSALVRISELIEDYRVNQDLPKLKKKYSTYLAAKAKPSKLKINYKAAVNGFKTFDIAPTGSYFRYLHVVKNTSDFDAIYSDWEAVGNDLSSAFIKEIINYKQVENNSNNQ
ncbi:MAG: hypothetical protein U9R28_10405 [Pseudomonadota bacterium]|nr:hypothetical protein [Pseudomonadota bacterium]